MTKYDGYYDNGNIEWQHFDDDGRQSAKETSGDTEQQHELLVGQMGSPPFVETINPVASFLLCHGSFDFRLLK